MDVHQACLNLGSNVEPELNLPRAVQLLKAHGHIEAVSSVWESKAVGSSGPNFLNACVLLSTALGSPLVLKDEAIGPIEMSLGRVRSQDRYASRPIDIDIVIFDGNVSDVEGWRHAFLVVPLAELDPDLAHPITGAKLRDVSKKMQEDTWISRRPDVLIACEGNPLR